MFFRRAVSTPIQIVGIVIIVLIVVGVLIFGPIRLLRKGSSDVGRFTACNTQLQKCACFFEDNFCPTDSQSEVKNSEDCPSEGYPELTGGCAAAGVYEKLLKRARSESDKVKKDNPEQAKLYFGSCCIGNWKDHPSLRRT